MSNEDQGLAGLLSEGATASSLTSDRGADAPVTAVAPGRWVLDTGSSSASFSVSNLGVKVVHGSVPVSSGVAEVSTDGELSSVQAVLALAEVATANARRDADLAKPHLLDTARYPTMSFSGAGTDSLVSGVLSVRGVEVPLELRMEVTPDGPGRVTITATTGFDRSPLGMKVPRFFVGGWIEVSITATFTH